MLEITLGNYIYRFQPLNGRAFIRIYKPDGSSDTYEYKTIEEGMGHLNFILMQQGHHIYDFNKGVLRTLNENDVQ